MFTNTYIFKAIELKHDLAEIFLTTTESGLLISYMVSYSLCVLYITHTILSTWSDFLHPLLVMQFKQTELMHCITGCPHNSQLTEEWKISLVNRISNNNSLIIKYYYVIKWWGESHTHPIVDNDHIRVNCIYCNIHKLLSKE